MNVTICPPSPQRPDTGFDKMQFAGLLHYPVNAHYVGLNEGINGWASTGISFGDYSGSMSTVRRKVKYERKLPTPAYMHDEKTFRAVMLRYLELRVGGFHCKNQSGTEVERSLRVAARSKLKAEKELMRLDEYSREYVALRSAAAYGVEVAERLRWLRIQIACTDTSIRILREPWVIPQICRLYYFQGLNSAVIGAQTGLTPCNVRQILYRISQLAEKLQQAKNRTCYESGNVQVVVPRASSVQV